MDITIHEYIELLNSELDSRFPNTTRIAIAGGDYIMDWVMELREGDSELKYSPYEIFVNSYGSEDGILQLCNEWERIRQQ